MVLAFQKCYWVTLDKVQKLWKVLCRAFRDLYLLERKNLSVVIWLVVRQITQVPYFAIVKRGL